MGLESVIISGYKSGVIKNKKPFLLTDDAFQGLTNAYCYREEIRKRQGLKYVGRFRRAFTDESLGNSQASPWSINTLYSTLTTPITPETYAEIQAGSVVITIQAGPDIVFTDQGDGTLTSPTLGNSGTINYLTGVITLTHTAGAGVATIVSFAYYPTLPAMGIKTREVTGLNDEQTIWFDTKYAYINVGTNFQEFLPASGVTWDGNDSDFFWTCNYRGSDAGTRLFFVTNFNNSAGSPMRYTDGVTWSSAFEPAVDSTNFIFTARILIPYYGRLLALNVYEGPDRGSAINYYNRCRFSQIGSPIAADAWRVDIRGKGGLIDAPVDEDIVSATFYKNTLIVRFERSTWRLQYIGEYGTPFIWERISSDFGSESTFSSVLFDSGVLDVGDKAITGSSGNDVQRIDLDIPDTVYTFKNADNGVKRVHGIRDFKKELVYWCYPDYTNLNENQKFPNQTLVYNYRNNTFAFFRNNVTCYGNFQYQTGITWDRADIFWSDSNVYWDSGYQSNYPVIVSGNQHGFAHFYGYPDVQTEADSTINANDQESLAVRDVVVTDVVTLTIPDHNLTDGEVIYLTGLVYQGGSTDLNDEIYFVQFVDKDNIVLFKYNQSIGDIANDFDVNNSGTYVGGGVVALFPKMEIVTKDFNPAKAIGQNIVTSYIDFLFDVSAPANINVQMIMNTDANNIGNLLIGNTNVETANTKTGYINGVTLANPCVINSKNHGLLNGKTITIQQIKGTTELNGNSYTVTFIDTDNFSIDEDSTLFTAYESGGFWVQTNQEFWSLSSQYSWHRFFSTTFGQFVTIKLTYNTEQMSKLSTHQQNFVLNAMQLFYRRGGKNIFGL